MRDDNTFTTILIAVIAILVALLVPIPLSQEFRIIAVAGTLLIFIAIILSGFKKELKEQETEIKRINEKLKIHEQLTDIKVNLQLLQKEVYKNEKKRLK